MYKQLYYLTKEYSSLQIIYIEEYLPLSFFSSSSFKIRYFTTNTNWPEGALNPFPFVFAPV